MCTQPVNAFKLILGTNFEGNAWLIFNMLEAYNIMRDNWYTNPLNKISRI